MMNWLSRNWKNLLVGLCGSASTAALAVGNVPLAAGLGAVCAYAASKLGPGAEQALRLGERLSDTVMDTVRDARRK
jgi:hypothetical protein